jgi:hypothetical protein
VKTLAMTQKINAQYYFNWRWLYLFIIFVVLVIYYIKAINGNINSADITARLGEAQYWIKGINPYDVYFGNTPLLLENTSSAGMYSYISYYFCAILIAGFGHQGAVYIFLLIDIICLFFGIVLYNKLLLKTGWQNSDLLVLVITFVGIIQLDHALWLNYGFVSIFGLLLSYYGLQQKSYILVVLGSLLTGLKPSLLIPYVIYLILSKEIKAIILIILAYLVLGQFAAAHINISLLDLFSQLSATQIDWSKKGFFRFEGFFLFLRDIFPNRLTVIGIIATTAILYLSKKKLVEKEHSILLVISCSLSFFYNQIHAWLLVYPILMLSIRNFDKQTRNWFPIVFLLLFMWVPPGYTYFESTGFSRYMDYHNLVRFFLLIAATYSIINSDIKRKYFADKATLR